MPKRRSAPTMNSPYLFLSAAVLAVVVVVRPAAASAGFATSPTTTTTKFPTNGRVSFGRTRRRRRSSPSFAAAATALRAAGGKGGFGRDTNLPSSYSPPPSSSSGGELFELQEIRAQLQTVMEKNLPYQTMSKEKRDELSSYVTAVVEKSASPIDASDSKGMGTARFVSGIENKSWRMVFSTSSDSSSASSSTDDLPFGSTVVLRIGTLDGPEGPLDYVLKFSKRVFGLDELVAKSSYSIDIGPVNPGVLTFVYEEIKTKLFGMSNNIPVGFFGLLKGRANYVDTVWFDGTRWIDRTYAEDGGLIYGVYVRDLEDEKAWAKVKE